MGIDQDYTFPRFAVVSLSASILASSWRSSVRAPSPHQVLIKSISIQRSQVFERGQPGPRHGHGLHPNSVGWPVTDEAAAGWRLGFRNQRHPGGGEARIERWLAVR